MRRLLIVPLLLVATTASAGDWWIQAFGSSSWALTTKGTYGVDIDNGAIQEEDLKAPVAKPYLGGGLMIGSNSDEGQRMYGIVFDYLTGKRTTGLTIQDPYLSWGDIITDSSALAVTVFYAGRSSFLSSDSGSWQGYLGGGAGVISPMGDLTIEYRDLRNVEDPPGSGNFVEKRVEIEESTSISGTMFAVDLFLMEEWHFSDSFGLAVTLGFRGVPYKDTKVETETMSGTYRSQYTGPYVRLGLRYDL